MEMMGTTIILIDSLGCSQLQGVSIMMFPSKLIEFRTDKRVHAILVGWHSSHKLDIVCNNKVQT